MLFYKFLFTLFADGFAVGKKPGLGATRRRHVVKYIVPSYANSFAVGNISWMADGR